MVSAKALIRHQPSILALLKAKKPEEKKLILHQTNVDVLTLLLATVRQGMKSRFPLQNPVKDLKKLGQFKEGLKEFMVQHSQFRNYNKAKLLDVFTPPVLSSLNIFGNAALATAKQQVVPSIAAADTAKAAAAASAAEIASVPTSKKPNEKDLDSLSKLKKKKKSAPAESLVDIKCKVCGIISPLQTGAKKHEFLEFTPLSSSLSKKRKKQDLAYSLLQAPPDDEDSSSSAQSLIKADQEGAKGAKGAAGQKSSKRAKKSKKVILKAFADGGAVGSGSSSSSSSSSGQEEEEKGEENEKVMNGRKQDDDDDDDNEEDEDEDDNDKENGLSVIRQKTNNSSSSLRQ